MLTPIDAQIYRRAAPTTGAVGARADHVREGRASDARQTSKGGEMAAVKVGCDGLTEAERATSGRAFVEAVSNPVRSRLLALLGTRPMSAADLAARIGEPAAKVRYHLRWLRERGFIRVRELARRRGVTEQLLEESAVGFVEGDVYADLAPRHRTVFVNHSIRAIMIDATSFVRAGRTYDDHFPGALRLRLRLDERGWREMADVMDATGKRLIAIRRAAAERLDTGSEPEIDASAALLYLEQPAPGDDGPPEAMDSTP